MEQYYNGNLAFDRARKQLEFGLNNISPERWNDSPERIIERKLKEEAERREKRQAEIHILRKTTIAERRKRSVYGLVYIIFISLIFSGLMVRQASIYEQNFANTSIRKDIQMQREKNIDLQNRLISQSDTAHIESEALRLFSLRKPSQMQRITVDLPDSDQVIFYEKNILGDGSGQSQSNNYQVLEAYMRAISENLH